MAPEEKGVVCYPLRPFRRCGYRVTSPEALRRIRFHGVFVRVASVACGIGCGLLVGGASTSVAIGLSAALVGGLAIVWIWTWRRVVRLVDGLEAVEDPPPAPPIKYRVLAAICGGYLVVYSLLSPWRHRTSSVLLLYGLALVAVWLVPMARRAMSNRSRDKASPTPNEGSHCGQRTDRSAEVSSDPKPNDS